MTYLDAVLDFAQGTSVILAAGTCAAFGGIPKAPPNPTGIMGVKELLDSKGITGKTIVNIAGCPANPDWTVGTIVRLLLGQPLPLDAFNRPTEFYGKNVHENCPRNASAPTHYRIRHRVWPGPHVPAGPWLPRPLCDGGLPQPQMEQWGELVRATAMACVLAALSQNSPAVRFINTARSRQADSPSALKRHSDRGARHKSLTFHALPEILNIPAGYASGFGQVLKGQAFTPPIHAQTPFQGSAARNGLQAQSPRIQPSERQPSQF